nr:hypothetical protein [Tanacetum cinerariifolium]
MQMDDSKTKLRFRIDQQEVEFCLDDLRIVLLSCCSGKVLYQASSSTMADTVQNDDDVSYMISSVKLNANGMRILDELLTEDMKQIEAYKWYDDDCRGVEVPTAQPSPIVSSQGMQRTLSAPRQMVFCKRDHDDHPDSTPKGDKGAKNKRKLKGHRLQMSHRLHQYNICRNFKEASLEFMEELKGREEDLMAQVLEKEALIFYGPQRNLNAHARFSCNNDLFYLKKGNTKAKKWTLSLHKIYATSFSKEYLEELLKRWSTRKKHRKERLDPKEVYSDHQIVEVIRIANEKEYGQDFMEEIIVKRADGKAYIFSRSDYKYLSKDDIEDMKKRVMNIENIPKFGDATLKKILEKVLKINRESRLGFKDPPLSDVAKEVMEILEEIQKRLKHRRHDEV